MSQETNGNPPQISLRNPGRPLNVGIILLCGTTEILDIAPVDVFTAMTPEALSVFPPGVIPEEMKKQAIETKFIYVNETGKPAKLTSGMSVNVTHTFDTCPPLDVCILGATIDIPTYQPTENELTFLRTTYASPTLQAFLTICAGMLPALQAGLLEGKRATAPRPMLSFLRQTAPGTQWTERRWEVDESGKMWTSGTLLNGTDMVREWAGRTFGKDMRKDLMAVALEFGGWPSRDVGFGDDDVRLGMKNGDGNVMNGADVEVRG